MTFKELFGTTIETRLLDFLGDHVGSMYSINELDKHVIKLKENRATLNKLIDAGLIKKVQPAPESICYMINDMNQSVRAMLHYDFMEGKKAMEREAKK